MENKILVAAPTFEGMKYCHDRFFNRILNLSYKNYDILIVDNSKTEEYFQELKKIPNITAIHDKTTEEKSIFRLISSRNLILEYGIKNNYSHILMLDSDVIPPIDVIEELLQSDKDIVSGIYSSFFNIAGKTKLMPVAWKYLTEEEFIEMKRNYDVNPGLKRFDLRRYLTEEEINSDKLHEVAMPSAGCMLIKRQVFEKVRYGKENPKSFTGDDIHFIEKAKEFGFLPYCNTKVKCEHLIVEKYKKDKNGNFVHSSFSDLI